MFSPESLIERSSDVLFRELDGETVLFHPRSGSATTLDRIGAIIWQAVAETVRFGDLVDELAAAFDAPEAKVHADVTELLSQLAGLNLIVVASPSPQVE